MIRPFTCLSVLLAAGSGLYLYSEKHRTTLLDDRIRVVVDDTHRIEDRTAMLRAEWALLNQPDRLQTLAAKFLPGLQPIEPTQFVQLAELARHLPPVGAPPVAAPLPVLSAMPGAVAPPVALASAVTAVPAAEPAPPTSAIPAARHGAPAAVPGAHQAPLLRLAGMPRRAATPARRRVMIASLAPSRVAPSHEVVDPVRDAAYVPPRAIAAPLPAWRPSAPAAPSFTGSALGMAGAAIAPPMAAR